MKRINHIGKLIKVHLLEIYVYVTSYLFRYRTKNRHLLENPRLSYFVIKNLDSALSNLFKSIRSYYFYCWTTKREEKLVNSLYDYSLFKDKLIVRKQKTIHHMHEALLFYLNYFYARNLKSNNSDVNERVMKISDRVIRDLNKVIYASLSFSCVSYLDNGYSKSYNLKLLDIMMRDLDKSLIFAPKTLPIIIFKNRMHRIIEHMREIISMEPNKRFANK